METTLQVTHVTVKVNSRFDAFTAKLESSIGQVTPADFDKLEVDPVSAIAHLHSLAGVENMMLFSTIRHGNLLRIIKQRQNAIQYEIGNPFIAMGMTKEDIRAGLYAPLRILVHEGVDQQVYVDYDLPSSLTSQFSNEKVQEVALSLDGILQRLIEHADAHDD